MANRFLNNIKINDAYTLPPTIGTTGQYIKLTDAATGATAWSDLGQAAEVSTISYEVRNESGSSIPIGSVVYVDGGSGSSDHVTIALSDASSESTSSKTFGITAETIANNSTGKVILEGLVEGIDTSAFSPGDTLWLSTTAGEFENTIPVTPDHAVFVGYAVRCQQNNGSIFVKIQNGYELGEIHDIKLTSVANNDLLSYNSTQGFWENVALAASNITSTDITNWNTAYGWGDHSLAGYLTSYTETDPIFSASAAAAILAGDIANWNTAYGWGDHSLAGYLTSYTETDPVFSASAASGITSTDIANWNSGVGYTETDTLNDVTGRGSTTTDSITIGGLHVDSTGAVEMPAGSTAQRPTGIAGMFRFNSEDSQFEGYDGTQWGAIAGSGGGGGGAELSIERDVFTATANQTAFTISSAITASSNTQVYIDGVYQAKSNYTTSGSTITFSTGVPAGAEVEVVHFISVLSKVYTDTFTGDASTVNFTASKDVTDENVTQVYIDGVYQSKDNYTTSGTTITFSTAPPSGSAIEVVHFTAAEYSTLNSNQFTGTGSQTDFTLTQGVTVDNSFVFVQGVYQEKDTYSISGTTLTFTTAPLSGYSIEVITVGSVSIFNDTLYVDNFNGTGSQVDYTLSTSPASENAIDVYINGLYQQKDTFSLSGSTLTFSAAPPNGSTIEVKSTGGLNNVLGNITLTAGTGISIVENSNNNFTISNTLIDVTVSYNTPTGGGFTYTTPSSSIGQAGSIYGPQTFTITDGINALSGTASISGLPNGLTIDSQSYNNTNGGNILTITLGGVFPSANSLNTNLTISGLTSSPVAIDVDYLVVAGGGGASWGAGGAGGLRTSYGSTSGGGASAESSLALDASTNYTITVGSGGNAGNGSTGVGSQGSNSVFSTITSTGGGGGQGNANSGWNGDGGSGGGAANNLASGGAATSSPVQGYDGGGGNNSSGAGGGGASAVGTTPPLSNPVGGDGGNGLSVTILSASNATASSVGEVSGSNVYYAGGGGGGNRDGYSTGIGGLGGGGDASPSYSSNAQGGATNTGGGGGGASYNNYGSWNGGGAGGSGVVIIRYSNIYTITIGAGLTGTTTTDGSDKITTFTAGTGNISFS